MIIGFCIEFHKTGTDLKCAFHVIVAIAQAFKKQSGIHSGEDGKGIPVCGPIMLNQAHSEQFRIGGIIKGTCEGFPEQEAQNTISFCKRKDPALVRVPSPKMQEKSQYLKTIQFDCYRANLIVQFNK